MRTVWTTASSLVHGFGRKRAAGVVLVAAIIAFVPAAAQLQNPVHTAKDAWNKAKHPQPPQQSANNVPTDSSHPPASGQSPTRPSSPSEVTASQSTARTDPRPMPDIMGVRLGMPAREAYAVLQAAYPKAKLYPDPLELPIVDKPILNGFSTGYEPRNNYERIVVLATPPPDKQVVWRVRRAVIFKEPINRANVMASLREKYGKETVMFEGPSSQQKADEAHAGEMWWLFDEQGRPAPLPNSDALHNTLLSCAAKFDRGDDANNPNFAVANITSPASRESVAEGGWCNTSMIAVIAQVVPQEILTGLQVEMVDIPAMTRAARSELLALDAWAKQQQQQEVEKSKQQKPKL